MGGSSSSWCTGANMLDLQAFAQVPSWRFGANLDDSAPWAHVELSYQFSQLYCWERKRAVRLLAILVATDELWWQPRGDDWAWA